MLGERYGKRVPNERERRVIALVAEGLKNHEVAEAMGTTEHVVKNYLRVIYDKLGLWNRVELALWYEARRHEPAHTLWPRTDAPHIIGPGDPGSSRC
jgi:DNA-binding CsgD family transcriptional regulator